MKGLEPRDGRLKITASTTTRSWRWGLVLDVTDTADRTLDNGHLRDSGRAARPLPCHRTYFEFGEQTVNPCREVSSPA